MSVKKGKVCLNVGLSLGSLWVPLEQTTLRDIQQKETTFFGGRNA